MNNNRKKFIREKEGGILQRQSYFLASLFGIGFVPVMPGTVASLATLPLVWLLLRIGQYKGLIIGTLIILAVSYFVVAIALKYTKDDHDPSFIVLDEVIGQLITFFLPALIWGAKLHFALYPAGFLLFRFFDILKPFHVGWVQKNVKGALGVILDDIIAALYATLILVVIAALINIFPVAAER